MTDKDLKDTKDRILKAAEDLFAKNGYSGASIREIASTAGVNLSAVNYHFKNKQTLYWNVFESSYNWLSNGIEEIGKDDDVGTKELAWLTYKFFVDNGHHMLNIFKMFLSEDIPVPDGSFEQACRNEDGSHGSPGQLVFLEKITNEVGEDVPVDGRYWAMHMIFSDIVEFSLKANSPLFKEELKHDSFFDEEELKKSVYFLVEAIVQYLKANPENWK